MAMSPAPAHPHLLTLPPPPSPSLHHPLQDLLFEEATLLRQRELELKARLSGAPEAAPVVPVVMVRAWQPALPIPGCVPATAAGLPGCMQLAR